MRTFRYDTSGRWYKGNSHVHTTASDGGLTPPELARLYAAAGYEFLFRTDHWVASDVEADVETDHEESPLLWLDGLELDGRDETGSYFHVVCLGRSTGIARGMGFAEALESARSQGALLVLAHPHWSGNTLDDGLRRGFGGVEIYNHVCRWLNGKGDGGAYWTAMLDRFPGTLAFASDDAHVGAEHPGWNGGWIAVNCAELSREAILAAVRAGNFYSTCGPEFHAIELDGSTVAIRTSPVRFMRLVGPAYRGQRRGSFEGPDVREAAFEVPGDWAYAYLEIEDSMGRRAWTNTLFR